MSKKKAAKKRHRRVKRTKSSLQESNRYVDPYIRKYKSAQENFMRNCTILEGIPEMTEKVNEAREELLEEVEFSGETMIPSDFKKLCAHVRGGSRISGRVMDDYRDEIRRSYFPTNFHNEEKGRRKELLEQLSVRQQEEYYNVGKQMADRVLEIKEKEQEITECEQKIQDIYDEVDKGISYIKSQVIGLKKLYAKTDNAEDQLSIQETITYHVELAASIQEEMATGNVTGFCFDPDSDDFGLLYYSGDSIEELREKKNNAISRIKELEQEIIDLGADEVWTPKLHNLKKEPSPKGLKYFIKYW